MPSRLSPWAWPFFHPSWAQSWKGAVFWVGRAVFHTGRFFPLNHPKTTIVLPKSTLFSRFGFPVWAACPCACHFHMPMCLPCFYVRVSALPRPRVSLSGDAPYWWGRLHVPVCDVRRDLLSMANPWQTRVPIRHGVHHLPLPPSPHGMAFPPAFVPCHFHPSRHFPFPGGFSHCPGVASGVLVGRFGTFLSRLPCFPSWKESYPPAAIIRFLAPALASIGRFGTFCPGCPIARPWRGMDVPVILSLSFCPCHSVTVLLPLSSCPCYHMTALPHGDGRGLCQTPHWTGQMALAWCPVLGWCSVLGGLVRFPGWGQATDGGMQWHGFLPWGIAVIGTPHRG